MLKIQQIQAEWGQRKGGGLDVNGSKTAACSPENRAASFSSCCSPPFGDTRVPKWPDVGNNRKKEKLIIEHRSKTCPQIFEATAKRRRGREDAYSERWFFCTFCCGRSGRSFLPQICSAWIQSATASEHGRNVSVHLAQPSIVRPQPRCWLATSCGDANSQQMWMCLLRRAEHLQKLC